MKKGVSYLTNFPAPEQQEPFNEVRQLSVKVNSDEDDIAFKRLQDLIEEYGIETVVNKLIEA